MATHLLEPTVTDQSPFISAAQRLSDVRGKRLGFVDNSKCNADLFIQRLSAQLAVRFAVVRGPIIRKAAPKDRLAEADLASLAQCDAVVQCFGDCGTSTSISVADAVEIERRCSPELPLVRIPHPMHTAQRNVVAERADAVVGALVERLTSDVEETVETE